LRECTELVNAVEGKTVGEIFGFPDHLKFHSSMTLFARAGQGLKPLSGRGGDVAAEVAIHEDDLGESVFEAALRKYFGGMMDTSTVVRI